MLIDLLNLGTSVLLTTLSMPGYLFGGLAFVSLIGLFAALEKKGPALSMIYSFLFFFLYVFVNFHFLIDTLTREMPQLFGKFSAAAGVGVYILFCAWEALPFLLFGFLYGLWHDRVRFRFLQPMLPASLFVVSEFLRGAGDMGFTGGRLSEALYSFRGILQVLPFTGTLGLVFLIVVINYELYRLIRVSRYNLVSAFVVLGVLVLLDGTVERFLPSEVGNTPIVVAQTDLAQSVRYSPEKGRLLAYLRDHFAQTPAYLTIFPEATFPDTDIRGTEYEAELINSFSDRTLVIGFPTVEGDNFYNSLSIYDRGRYVGKYDKVKLFPFVEFLPYPQVFGFLRFLQGFTFFTPGTLRTFEIESYGRVGFQICFESYFPFVSRQLSRESGFLVVATNDGWYRSRIPLVQHFAQSILRAVEVRRDVVQVSNTGLSGVADAYGNFTILPSGTNARVLYVTPRSGETIYARYGDYVVLIALVLLVLCGLTARQRRTIFD